MSSSPSFRVLVVEDDPQMLELLRVGLWESGHSVVTATTAGEGEALCLEHQFDVLVLDVGLPDRSGFTVANRLRALPGRPAILMLTALGEEEQIVSGLDSGADDYLTKPFSFPELLARIASVCRRFRLSRSTQIGFGALTLDLRKRRLTHSGREIQLTRSEFLLLRELALHCDETVPRRQLMAAVWTGSHVSHGALDTLMAALREKIEPGAPGRIETVRGLGYVMRCNAPAVEAVPS